MPMKGEYGVLARHGSPARLVAYLRTLPPGSSLSTAAVAALLNIDRRHVGARMSIAVANGWLVRFKTAAPGASQACAFYALGGGVPPLPPEAPAHATAATPDPLPITQRIVAAAAAKLLRTRAPRSVFELARKAPSMPRPSKAVSPFPSFTPPPKANGRSARAVRIDPSAVPLHDNVPIPPIFFGRNAVNVYQALYERMKPGQMAELEARQAANFVAWARKNNKSVTRRCLNNGQVGVWRNPEL